MKRPKQTRADWVEEDEWTLSFLPKGAHISVGDRVFLRMPELRAALPRTGYRPVARDIMTRSTWYCRGRLRWLLWRGLLWLEGRAYWLFDWAYCHRLIHLATAEGEIGRWRDIRPGPWYQGMKGSGW